MFNKKFNLILIACFILFYSLSFGQSGTGSNSSKVKTNSGIIFQKESENRISDSSYTDVIQLFGLTEKAQAIQFRILINKSTDDKNILIFKGIQKGSDIIDSAWLLEFNVIKGKVVKDGASQDEIFVLLYNSNLDGGLLPGDYTDLIDIKYQVAKLPDNQNNIKSSIKISNAEASTFDGNAINVTPSRDEFIIYIDKK